MPKLLPPVRPIVYNKLNSYLLIAKLWLISLVVTLITFITGVLPNWGLIFSFASSLGLALAIAVGLRAWRRHQASKKLEEYEQAYCFYARQRTK